MSTDPSIREEAFPYFVNEATDLLQEIEQDLLTLREDQSAAKVHSLMRSAHTLKGAAATVGLETVKHVCHVLEDVFRGLYNPDIEIDDEIEALLFEGYDCLRTPLMAELNDMAIDDSDIMDRAAAVISRIQEKLGDLFDSEASIPTAEELGFDVVKSMFEAGVEQRLSALEGLLSTAPPAELASQMQTMAEVFLGLAESLQLPGFGGIAQVTLKALGEYPALQAEIVQAAYEDFRAGQKLVLAGDRTQGGQPSSDLLDLAQGQSTGATADAALPSPQVDEAASMLEELGAGLENLFGELPVGELPGEQLLPEPSEAQVTETMQVDDSMQDADSMSAATAEPLPAHRPLEDLFGGVDLEALSPLTEGGSEEAPVIPAASNLAVDNATADDITADNTAADDTTTGNTTADSAIADEPAAEAATFESLDNLFGGVDLSAADMPQLASPVAEACPEPQVTETQVAGAQVAEAQVTEAEITELQATEVQAEVQDDSAVQNLVAEATQSSSEPAQSEPAQSKSSKSSTAKSGPTKSGPTKSKTTAGKIASNGVKGGNRSAQVNVRVGLDQVLRLDHLVGELLTNQIQTAEEDEQVRSGVRELLDQLRQHRRTLSDLQSVAQQIGMDDWEIDPRLKRSQSRGKGFQTKGHKKEQKKTQSQQKRQEKALTSPVSIPQLSLGAQFDALELDRYSDLHVLSQKALNESVQLEIVIEAVDQMTKRTRQTRDLRHRLFCQLRDDLAAVRLKPVGELFNRFPRVIQQLSTTYSKKVNLKLTGSHVLVDKVTLDSLYDSLLHLVRNGFDHGIETPEARVAAEKSPEGNLELKAYQQGNRTIIEIRDDGGGIDPERIAAKAIEKGLIDATETTEFSEAEVLDFLFHSGFSTAAKVSDLSGRGVGLDVVRAQIEKLEGAISIRSELGQGTTFILSLPLSVTVTKQLICKSYGSTYAIAADTVQQVILPRQSQLRKLDEGRFVFELKRNDKLEQIPVQSLAHLLPYAKGIPGAPSSMDNTTRPILLLNTPEGQRGIQVDQVLGEQEVSIRSLGSAIAAPDYIQGCTVLGDSQLALAIEPTLLLQQVNESTQARSIAIGMHAAEKPSATRLLIIDDSLTQRRTLERTLQTVGHEVIQAEDGLDAIVNLKRDSNIDLIVCDLEMPRMNGFEFISQTRTLPGISEIPIVILTSRSGGKYRQLALELGASAFLSKPYTDFELLNQVSELLQTKGATRKPMALT